MSSIKQNPFRVLGLMGNASEREIQKQINIIQRYAEVGKTKTFEYDFDFLGGLSRTKENVKLAASQIEQAHKKIEHALFWFINSTQFDEIALNHLKKGNIDKAIEIWDKTLKSSVTNRNYSSYQNLSTLYIALSSVNGKLDREQLQKGIELKERVISSDNIKQLIELVAGNTLKIGTADVSKIFVDETLDLLKPYLNKKNGLPIKSLISIFSSFNSETQKYLTNKFTEGPIANIEKEIERTIEKRKNTPQDAEIYSEELFEKTNSDLKTLKRILSVNNIQYQMIVNKLANEILQCSIDFFNYYRENESDFDPGDDALKVIEYAENIGATGQVLERIKENKEVIQEWVNNKPDREKEKLVKEEIEFIISKLENFQEQPNSITNAKMLIEKCSNKIIRIKEVLGSTNELYLNISSSIVNNVQRMLVAIVNNISKSDNLSKIRKIVEEAIIISNTLDTFDMFDEVRKHFKDNYKILKDIAQNLRIKNLAYEFSKPITNTTIDMGQVVHNGIQTQRKKRLKEKLEYIKKILFTFLLGSIGIIFFLAIENSNSNDVTRKTKKKTTSTIRNYSNNPSDAANKKHKIISNYKGNKLKNGTSPYNKFFGSGIYNKNHNNWVLFKNGYNTDAIICLFNRYSGKTIRNEYIQAGTSFKMTNIPNGTYYLKVFSGKDWNPNKLLNNGRIKGGFDTDISFYQSNDPIRVMDDGYQYTTGEITLYKVSNGNMRTQGMSENSFFN